MAAEAPLLEETTPMLSEKLRADLRDVLVQTIAFTGLGILLIETTRLLVH